MSRYSDAVLADAPLGYWRLGEKAGDAQDLSGYGREAVVSGGVTRQQLGAVIGDPDTAMQFNGSTGYLQAPALALAGPFSVEAFVKPGAYPGTSPTYNDFVIQRSGYNANGVIGQWTASNVFNFGASMYPGANAYFFSTVNRDPALWWHLVLSYDPVLGAVLYINGAADVTRPDIVGVPSLGSQPWTMATGFYPAQTFSGCSLDEVAIYASALSPARVLSHYQAAVPSVLHSTAMLAVQAEVFATLNVPAVTSLAPVYDAVPEGRGYPYVEIGELEETLSNVFGKNGRSLLVSIHIYSDAAGYKEAEAILEQLNILLDDTLLPNPVGWRTNQNEYAIGSAQKEFDVVELRHVIARYHIDVTQT